MRTIQVKSLSKIDPSKYIEGDFFLTSQSVAILMNGKVEPLVKQSDLKRMIREEVKKVLKDEK